MADAGYSGTPLAKKLSLKGGQAVAFAALPGSLDHLTGARRISSVRKVADWRDPQDRELDYVHLFTDSAATVDADNVWSGLKLVIRKEHRA